MQQHLVLRAKVLELEEAYREASKIGDVACMETFNIELIRTLLRLVNAIRTAETDN